MADPAGESSIKRVERDYYLKRFQTCSIPIALSAGAAGAVIGWRVQDLLGLAAVWLFSVLMFVVLRWWVRKTDGYTSIYASNAAFFAVLGALASWLAPIVFSAIG